MWIILVLWERQLDLHQFRVYQLFQEHSLRFVVPIPTLHWKDPAQSPFHQPMRRSKYLAIRHKLRIQLQQTLAETYRVEEWFQSDTSTIHPQM